MPRRELRIALLLSLLSFVVYNANLRTIAQGDSLPARYLPFLLLRHGTFHLDPMASLVAATNPHPHWIVQLPDGHEASLYPVVTPLLVTPLYLPAVAWMDVRGWSARRLFAMAMIMEKLAASTVASLAVFVLALALCRRASLRTAALLTVAFAFGTNTWAISSQALWQHGMGELLLAGALWAVTARATPWTATVAGLCLGLLPANRPPDLLLALGFLPFAWGWSRGNRVPLVASAALAPVFIVVYNLSVFGRLDGGYGAYGLTSLSFGFFAGSLLPGVAGLLASPGRGLFVFSPFLLFLPLAARRIVRWSEPRLLTAGLAAGVFLQLVLYALTDWRGGFSWGYRFLTDALPILIWLLIPVVESQGRLERAAFVAAVLVSIWVQTIGAFRYAGASDQKVFRDGDPANRDMAPTWDPANCPILVEAKSGVAPPNLVSRLLDL